MPDMTETNPVAEGIPAIRDNSAKAWLPIMYGCDNFCTYCVVPYVRGRERSRTPEDIIAEVRKLAADGVKEVMLLGQNVNSYGKDMEGEPDFADLLRMINEIPGEFWIRFTTSHPKDCSKKLLEALEDNSCQINEEVPAPYHVPDIYLQKKFNMLYL